MLCVLHGTNVALNGTSVVLHGANIALHGANIVLSGTDVQHVGQNGDKMVNVCILLKQIKTCLKKTQAQLNYQYLQLTSSGKI